MLGAQLRWWFAFFPGSASGLANGDHKPGLLTRQLATAGGSAAAADFGEILAHFRGQRDAIWSGHQTIVSGLR
jgi:hypothetical protein